jgi:hypothetical protein
MLPLAPTPATSLCHSGKPDSRIFQGVSWSVSRRESVPLSLEEEPATAIDRYRHVIVM